MERRSKRLLRWVLLSALVVALWLGGRFLLSAIDTFGDMEARLDDSVFRAMASHGSTRTGTGCVYGSRELPSRSCPVPML